MGLESATHLDDLDETWPTGLDPTNKGDDHIRMIKDVLKTVFPGAALAGFATPITASEAELNIMDGVTANAAELNITDGLIASTAELNFVDGVTSAIQTQLDAHTTTLGEKVDKAGDTMTGQLAGITPVGIADLTRKDYVDGGDATVQASADLRVLKSGDTMTGALLGVTPTLDTHLTRKDYVDTADALKVDKAGDTMTGQLAGITPVGVADLTRKDYVDAADTLLQANIDAEKLDANVKMLFYQNTAPTGWTIVSTVDEHSVRLTKGSVAGGQAGGVLGGTDNFSTVFGLQATDSHTLNATQIPGHTHTIAHTHTISHTHGAGSFVVTHGTTSGGGSTVLDQDVHQATGTTPVTGTSGGASPGSSGGSSAGSSGVGTGGGLGHSHNIDLRVKWASCIVCNKTA